MSSTVAVAGKPRALLLCYLCSPEHGSEPGVGWNQAVAVADAFEVTVITLDDERYRPAIERRLAAPDAPPIKFVFVPKTPRELRLTQVSWLYYVTLHRWHQRAFNIARQLHAEQPFDLVHQVNLCGYREPGLLWRLGPPFIWGPVGGTQNIPTQFFSDSVSRKRSRNARATSLTVCNCGGVRVCVARRRRPRASSPRIDSCSASWKRTCKCGRSCSWKQASAKSALRASGPAIIVRCESFGRAISSRGKGRRSS